ncbi:HAMP domain-containing sensor histidine kinase [Nibrella saemangeumensis]|uniref:histidine kinase n=1 Tax=Nibrella saemangeumensis TaxID=1084526 RepID=A0ABP8MWJ8_9BACT
MQIKHKLILWFSLLVASILLVFSFYVYFTYMGFRQRAIEDRLERKARVTEHLLTLRGTVAGSVISTIPEQAEFVYSPADSLIYVSNPENDFVPDSAFREEVRQKGLIRFTYPSRGHNYLKDGVALTYPSLNPAPDGRPYVAVVTAYDQDGYQRQETLRDLFLFGIAVAIGLVVVLGFFFSRKALEPLNDLIDQLNSAGSQSLNVRLKAENPDDEVGVLATAFNELLTRQERLIDSQRSFIAQASHELRTPLTTIKGWLETSIAYDTDPDQLKRGMVQAVRELDKLTALSNGLLQLARIDDLNSRIDHQPVELMDVLLDAADTIGQQKLGQPLSVQVSDEVLEYPAPLMIDGNTHLLKTALLNLLENAAKYSAGKPVTVHLAIGPGNQAHIRIIDQGIGVKPGEEDLIFLPLVRGSNVEQIQGFGIGLTLARRIITLHRGNLRLFSRNGEGTTAEITLPMITR